MNDGVTLSGKSLAALLASGSRFGSKLRSFKSCSGSVMRLFSSSCQLKSCHVAMDRCIIAGFLQLLTSKSISEDKMASYSTNEFRGGLKVMLDGEPCSILENEFVKPGKGQAFNRVKMKNLNTGRVWERTFKSGESLEGADVMDIDLEYLYTDGEFWHFMEPNSFEQYQADAKAVGDNYKWLKEQDKSVVTLYNGAPIAITPPNHVELVITETDPGVKGDTAQGGTKPATLATGAVVKVPLFIAQGETIKVDTRTGEYLGRASSK